MIADFNNDGKLDIFIIGGYVSKSTLSHGRAYALTAGNGTGPGWPMFRHDLNHSGCFNGYPPYQRGDANADGVIDVSDVLYLINYLFRSGPLPEPEEAGGANCDGRVSISDVIYLVNYLFRGGHPPGC